MQRGMRLTLCRIQALIVCNERCRENAGHKRHNGIGGMHRQSCDDCESSSLNICAFVHWSEVHVKAVRHMMCAGVLWQPSVVQRNPPKTMSRPISPISIILLVQLVQVVLVLEARASLHSRSQRSQPFPAIASYSLPLQCPHHCSDYQLTNRQTNCNDVRLTCIHH